MGSDGALILELRMRVRECFPVEQNPEAQGELDVCELFQGGQLHAEGIRWTNLVQTWSSHPPLPLHFNRPTIYTAYFYSSELLFPFFGDRPPPTNSQKRIVKNMFCLENF